MAEFFVGEEFESFENFEVRKKEYCKQNYVNLYIRDSRLINSAMKRGTIREGHIKQELKYYEVKYACVHGRKHYSSRSKGLRSTR